MSRTPILRLCLFVCCIFVTGVASQAITLRGPSTISNCTSNVFTWSGGIPPYTFYAGPKGRGSSQPQATTTLQTYSYASNWANSEIPAFYVAGQNGTQSSIIEIPVANCVPESTPASNPAVNGTVAQPVVASEPNVSSANPGPTSQPVSAAIITTTTIVSGTAVVITSAASLQQSLTESPSPASSLSFSSSSTSRQQSSSSSASVTGSPTASASVSLDLVTGPASPSINVAAIAGGIAAAVVIIIAIILIFLWRRRRENRAAFHRVDLNEPCPALQYFDKPLVDDQQAYHITPYAATSPILSHPTSPSAYSGVPLVGSTSTAPSTYPSDLKSRNESPIELRSDTSAGPSGGNNLARTYSGNSLQQSDGGLPPNYDAAMGQSRADLGAGSSSGK